MKQFFLARIKAASTLDELDYIVEQASENITSNTDYMEIYNAAMERVNEL